MNLLRTALGLCLLLPSTAPAAEDVRVYRCVASNGGVVWATEAFLDTDGFWEVETDYVDPAVDPSQVVPAPGAGLLMLGGLAALGLGRMRRRG